MLYWLFICAFRITLQPCCCEVDVSIVDRITALLNPQPLCRRNTKFATGHMRDVRICIVQGNINYIYFFKNLFWEMRCTVVKYVYYYQYSALGLVWARTRAQSGDWYGSGTLHPGQVLKGSLPLLSPSEICTEWKIFRGMIVTCINFTMSPVCPIGDFPHVRMVVSCYPQCLNISTSLTFISKVLWISWHADIVTCL